MGLTIHYNFKYRGSREELREKLKTFNKAIETRMDAPSSPIASPLTYEVGTLENESGYGLGPDSNDRPTLYEYHKKAACTSLSGVNGTQYRMPSESQWYDEHPEDRDASGYDSGRVKMRSLPGNEEVAEDWEAMVLPVYVMEGCEPFILTLGRKRGEETWVGRSFTKTQYANDFVKAQMSVVAMLDMLEELGFEVEVSDEGNYYETRDLEELTDNFEDYNDLVAKVGEMLDAVSGDDIEVEGSGMEVSANR
ncbi:MAG: hypothetical protein SVV03_02505 [Candidatus Nanohaloarchaea archaeon]|nr:hypothetical protein [Candidatus Nanohaloarchaea archaeon]